MADFLSQEEIDALLSDKGVEVTKDKLFLNAIEKDALGEIGNISMGSAATALSQLINKKVSITTPDIKIMTPGELIKTFEVPYVLVEVNFTDGLEGVNLLIIKVSDAVIIADLMMGGDGQNVIPELDEMKISAVGEAMNQMIGSAATAMSTIFRRSVKISPPTLTSVDFDSKSYHAPWEEDQKIAVVYFRMEIEDLIDSQIMQVMLIKTAKDSVNMLLGVSEGEAMVPEEPGPVVREPSETYAPEPKTRVKETAAARVVENTSPPVTEGSGRGQIYGTPTRNIDLILDVPLDIEVILGTTMKRINEILNLSPGAIVELDRLVDETVDITVNGTPIARGEVVVVNESFGVRISHILEPYERINQLRTNKV